MKRLLLAAVTAAAIVATPATAQARPVLDSPDAPYCGPGATYVAGYGCARTDLPLDPPGEGDAAGPVAALGAAWVLAWFIL